MEKKYPPLPTFLIFIVSLPVLWFSYDRISLIINSEYQSAKIISCDYSSQRKAKRRDMGKSASTVYKPIAITKNGIQVVGSLKWHSRKWCERRVGKEVSVFIHNKQSSKNSINSFFQLWLYPYISLFFFIIFLVCCRFKNPKVTPLIIAALVGTPLLMVIIEFLI